MRRSSRLIALALLSLPALASAQTPIPSSPTITIDVITLKAITLDANNNQQIRYTRAGTKPREFRTSANSSFTGASWLAFSEGTTTSKVVGSTTWITGSLAVPNVSGSGNCGANTIKIVRYFQFRGTNAQLRTITSNVVADSLCIPFG